MKSIFGIIGLLIPIVSAGPAAMPMAICKRGETVMWSSEKSMRGIADHSLPEQSRFEFERGLLVARVLDLQWEGSESLRFFGARWESCLNYSDSIRVISYRGRESYALQFRGRKKNESLVLYLPKEEQSMVEAFSWVRSWTDESQKNHALTARDDVRIPAIHMETSGLSLAVDGSGGTFSPKYRPQITMDYFPADPLRRFWFDRPFFLFLWRDGAEWPDAGVWFGNTDGLIKD